LILVEYGCLELYTEFEGNEFILDFLPAGSILNHKVLFMDDLMYVNVRAGVPTHILELTQDGFDNLE